MAHYSLRDKQTGREVLVVDRRKFLLRYGKVHPESFKLAQVEFWYITDKGKRKVDVEAEVKRLKEEEANAKAMDARPRDNG
jgi:hypothetical protein